MCGIQYIFLFYDIDLNKLTDRKLDEILGGHIPHIIALTAEVFQSHPNSILIMRRHIRRPVIENL